MLWSGQLELGADCRYVTTPIDSMHPYERSCEHSMRMSADDTQLDTKLAVQDGVTD